MKIYVGRWDLLPASWEGYNGLCEKSEEEIKAEVIGEVDIMEEDPFIAVYTPENFEDTFNLCLTRFITSQEYWIKIF